MTKAMYWGPGIPVPAWRLVAAALLRGASGLLAGWATGLVSRPTRPVTEPARVEFHAEAGAPEGALYLDGQFAGWIEGVNRL